MTQAIAWDKVAHDDVVRALHGYPRPGPRQFFADHGYAPTTTYDLVWEERTYPPKAILGTAYEFAVGTRLASGDFEGGKSGAVKVLGALGCVAHPRLPASWPRPPAPPPRVAASSRHISRTNPPRHKGRAICPMITKGFILAKDFYRIGVRMLRDHRTGSADRECRLALGRHRGADGGDDLGRDRVRVLERQERPAARHRGQAGVRERLAQLPSELGTEVSVVVAPQNSDRAAELAEPAGRVEQDPRANPPRELGQVAPDRPVGQRLYPPAGQPGLEGRAGQRPEAEPAGPHSSGPQSGHQAGNQRGMTP